MGFIKSPIGLLTPGLRPDGVEGIRASADTKGSASRSWECRQIYDPADQCGEVQTTILLHHLKRSSVVKRTLPPVIVSGKTYITSSDRQR